MSDMALQRATKILNDVAKFPLREDYGRLGDDETFLLRKVVGDARSFFLVYGEDL